MKYELVSFYEQQYVNELCYNGAIMIRHIIDSKIMSYKTFFALWIDNLVKQLMYAKLSILFYVFNINIDFSLYIRRLYIKFKVVDILQNDRQNLVSTKKDLIYIYIYMTLNTTW